MFSQGPTVRRLKITEFALMRCFSPILICVLKSLEVVLKDLSALLTGVLALLSVHVSLMTGQGFLGQENLFTLITFMLDPKMNLVYVRAQAAFGLVYPAFEHL